MSSAFDEMVLAVGCDEQEPCSTAQQRMAEEGATTRVRVVVLQGQVKTEIPIPYPQPRMPSREMSVCLVVQPSCSLVLEHHASSVHVGSRSRGFLHVVLWSSACTPKFSIQKHSLIHMYRLALRLDCAALTDVMD